MLGPEGFAGESDGDGVPNITDSDDDDDGVLDMDDASPLDAAETLDADGDGIGDNADVGVQLEAGQMIELSVVGAFTGAIPVVWSISETLPVPNKLNYSNGEVCFYTHVASDIIVDIAGYFSGTGADAFVGSTPKRFLDTRDGTGPRAQ